MSYLERILTLRFSLLFEIHKLYRENYDFSLLADLKSFIIEQERINKKEVTILMEAL